MADPQPARGLREEAIEVMAIAMARLLYPLITDEELRQPSKRWADTALHDADCSVIGDFSPEAEAALTALLSLLYARQFAIVPIEPTQDMLRAADIADDRSAIGNARAASSEEHWDAMIDVAPNPFEEPADGR